MLRFALFFLGSMFALDAARAGTVELAFLHPEQYTDAVDASGRSDATLQGLGAHLQRLGAKYLPADQTLRIDVLDVDLAGRMIPFRMNGDMRIINGRADWPRIKLHYSLESQGQVLQSADESIADMSYLLHTSGYPTSEALPYEKRMLEEWFKTRFVEHRPAGH